MLYHEHVISFSQDKWIKCRKKNPKPLPPYGVWQQRLERESKVFAHILFYRISCSTLNNAINRLLFSSMPSMPVKWNSFSPLTYLWHLTKLCRSSRSQSPHYLRWSRDATRVPVRQKLHNPSEFEEFWSYNNQPIVAIQSCASQSRSWSHVSYSFPSGTPQPHLAYRCYRNWKDKWFSSTYPP